MREINSWINPSSHQRGGLCDNWVPLGGSVLSQIRGVQKKHLPVFAVQVPTTQNNVQSSLFCGGISSTPAVIVWGGIFATLHPHLQNVKLHTQIQFSSVQFSCSVVSDSLRSHGLQHARPPCPSPAPRVYSNSSPLSRWCHPTIWSSVVPFSFLLQFSPASGSFQTSQLSALGG